MKNVYQAAASSVQLQTTGKQLMEVQTSSNSKISKRNEDHNISNCSEKSKSINLIDLKRSASSIKCKISEDCKVSWNQRSGCTRIWEPKKQGCTQSKAKRGRSFILW